MLGLDIGATEDLEYSKTLVISPLDTPVFKRYFSGGPYPYPVTMELIAFAGELLGISVKVYDPARPHWDSNSIFLIIMNSYDLLNKGTAVKKKRKTMNVDDYKQKYGIIEMLEVFGFDSLLRRVVQMPSISSFAPANINGSTVPQVQPLALTKNFTTKFGMLDAYLKLSSDH